VKLVGKQKVQRNGSHRVDFGESDISEEQSFRRGNNNIAAYTVAYLYNDDDT